MEDKTQKILDELKTIRIDIEFIKQNITDVDAILDNDDKEALKEYQKEKREGGLVSLDSVRCLK